MCPIESKKAGGQMLDRMPEKLANRTPDKMSEDIYDYIR